MSITMVQKLNPIIDDFIKKLDNKNKIKVNLDRPIYVQPEDSIKYRAMRLIIILGEIRQSAGMNKKVIACLDFLLKNSFFQKKFLIEYYSGKKDLIKKLDMLNIDTSKHFDQNIIQYKSVPWDLRFNDMFLFLKTRELIEYTGKGDNIRFNLSDKGYELFENIKEIFPKEINFLTTLGKRINIEKIIEIVTEIIPKTYWKKNEMLNN